MQHSTRARRRTVLTRRSALRSVGAATLVGAAGCLGSAGSTVRGGDDGFDVVVSFFSFYDFARKVAADTPVSVTNLVPTGLHGHGWEPDASITRDIVDADAFVHVGPGFQPWADRAIEVAEDDGADTALVNVREGIDLVPIDDTVDEEEAVGTGMDPHFWLDPTRAAQAVDNIVAGLTDLAPDHADAFEENAGSIRGELDALDGEYRRVFEDAPRDTIVLAAHNAFQYLDDRYDVRIEPLVYNLAANDDVKPADMRRATRLIEEHDIRHIGAAVFESQRPARQLVAETAVERFFPVTPYAGVKGEWVEQGWGYFEIARRVNLPTFEIVLERKRPDETIHAGYDGEGS